MSRWRDTWFKGRSGKFVYLAISIGLLLVLLVIVWRVFSEKGLYKQELEELGFDCEITTFDRVAAAEERLQDERAFIGIIAASSIAKDELLSCSHAEESYNFWVAVNDDIEILLGLAAEHYICQPVIAISKEEMATNLRFQRQRFRGNFLTIGQYVYGFQETHQQLIFAIFLDSEGIDYEEPTLSALACDNSIIKQR